MPSEEFRQISDRNTITMSNGTYLSLHDRRVRLIANAVRAHSQLTEKAAVEFAMQATNALNRIPEKGLYGAR
jgi:threonine aldolase